LRRTDIQERAMRTKTQKLMLQGGLILLGALLVSSIGGGHDALRRTISRRRSRRLR